MSRTKTPRQKKLIMRKNPLETVQVVRVKNPSTQLDWLKTEKIVELYDDRIRIKMISTKDRKKKTNIDIPFDIIMEVEERKFHGLKGLRGVLFNCKRDVVSDEGDILGIQLMLTFHNTKSSRKGAGLEQCSKLTAFLSNHNIESENRESSSGSLLSEENDHKPDEGDKDQENLEIDEQRNADKLEGAVLVKETPQDDRPKSGPGSPLSQHPDDLPIPSSQPRKIQSTGDEEDEEEEEEDIVIDNDLKHTRDYGDKTTSVKMKEKTRLRSCFDSLTVDLEDNKVKVEKYFSKEKKTSKIRLWEEAKKGLQQEDADHTFTSKKLKHSLDRMDQYGKQCVSLLLEQQKECYFVKESVCKIVDDIEHQRLEAIQLSSPSKAEY